MLTSSSGAILARVSPEVYYNTILEFENFCYMNCQPASYDLQIQFVGQIGFNWIENASKKFESII